MPLIIFLAGGIIWRAQWPDRLTKADISEKIIVIIYEISRNRDTGLLPRSENHSELITRSLGRLPGIARGGAAVSVLHNPAQSPSVLQNHEQNTNKSVRTGSH